MPVREGGRTELGVPFDVRHEREGNRRYAFGNETPRGSERTWILRTQAAERHRKDRYGGEERNGQWLHDSPPSGCERIKGSAGSARDIPGRALDSFAVSPGALRAPSPLCGRTTGTKFSFRAA